MLRLNVTRVGFLMGISLLLASVIYFFAANWTGLGRADKILASAGIMVLFYGVSFIFSKMKIMLGHHSFLSAIFLVGGCISFGASVALLNQIYNAQADTYTLFLVWSIPALLMSMITRYNPFYILTYILVHLTLWQYFFPTSLHVFHTDKQLLLIGCLFTLINLILFVVTDVKWLKSTPLKVISFMMFHTSLLISSVSFDVSSYKLWLNTACVLAIAVGFYYFSRIRLNKLMLTLNALAVSAFSIFKFVELLSKYASTAFFIYGLVFVALLLTGNIWFFRYLNKLGSSSSDDGERKADEHNEAHKSMLAGRIVSRIVTILGVFIGSISLIGLVLLASEGTDIKPQHMLFAIALLFIIPVILLPRINATIRYTVLTIGYAAGMVSIVWMHSSILSLLFLIVTIAGWFSLNGRAQHIFTYSLINLNVSIILLQLFDSVHQSNSIIVLILALMNAIIYECHFLLREGPLKQHIRECGLLFTLLFMFWLTIMTDIFPYSYELFNILNFIVVTWLAFFFVRRGKVPEAAMSLVFWFVFIGLKYYDLFWTLLHKSITLALLGVIAIAITYIFAYRTHARAPEEAKANHILLRKSPIMIAIVILLQLGYIGYHAAANEILISNGTSVKLEIAPLDPRSLLQGDYVTLRYSISTPPQAVIAELESRPGLSRIKVVLRPDASGVYVFDRLYKHGDKLADKEIIIKGTVSGSHNIYYGIETFFVAEGTGIETEQNARYAYIRVSSNGDALLERLSLD
ncbi:putative membrane-anchored protein/putative membrane protein [Paenibacillus castaneae]|uniref:GDYXXLXY domain-containing protein n=1 Tax=Paenibacillus castaneae TaxID=474957 RepID=UPI001ABB377D|nr:GDYXXLXY domain-containing protein [Paenibacillus castaneae]NIK79137.1 putative membrane-anchored protein/putative membrane protein [Paenibacillus castaneae]